MKKLLFLAMIGTLISCQERRIKTDCEWEWKITSNDKKWDIFDCHTSTPLDGKYYLFFQAFPEKSKMDLKVLEYVFLTQLPMVPGTYRPREQDSTSTVSFTTSRYDHQEDIEMNRHALDLKANNFYRVDSYDPETGLLTGGFHTEWLKQDASMPGPDRQVLHCEYFEVVLEEGVK